MEHLAPEALLLHSKTQNTKTGLHSLGFHSCFLTACVLNTNKKLTKLDEKKSLAG